MSIYFSTSQREDRDYVVSGLAINFTPTPHYLLYRCTSSWTDFPTNLPLEVDKIWRITLDKTAGIRVKIRCNGVEVLNVLLSDSMCDYRGWLEFWSKKVEMISFSYFDSASDYYRPGQTGNQ